MHIVFQLTVILCVLIGFGAAKLRFEDKLNQDMVEQRLIQPPLKKGTSLQLGQTSAAVALGGLRSLVAAVWNLRAFIHFEELNWIKLEESYEVITTLQPQTTHYWDTGAWHLHTNASVYYKENENLSPMRRTALQQQYIRKGSSLLVEGTLQNPDNWRLHQSLARLWSDHHKIPDLPRAVTHYKDVLDCETLPTYKRAQLRRFLFYTMTREQSQPEKTYALGLELFNESDRNHTPNLVSCLFALQNLLDIPENNRIPENKLFPNKKTQMTWLKNYYDHQELEYPMNGVHAKILQLQKIFEHTENGSNSR